MSGVYEGLTVIELADRRNQWAGKLLSDGGARVIQIEPIEGSPGRWTGPFVQDKPDADNCLDYWFNNTGKQSVALDLVHKPAQDVLRQLLSRADVFLESTAPGTLTKMQLDYASVAGNKGLIYASLTDFGQDGPWHDFQMNDAAHLALGGEMASTGYSDATVTPIGGKGNQAWHMGGAFVLHAITVALFDRMTSGEGQYIDVAIHDACAIGTEGAIPHWMYFGETMYRQTGMHAAPRRLPPLELPTRDGKYVMAINQAFSKRSWDALLDWMDEKGVTGELRDPKFQEESVRTAEYRQGNLIRDAIRRLIAVSDAEECFRRAQTSGIAWAMIRAAEENYELPHYKQRDYWRNIAHPQIGRAIPYPRGPFACDALQLEPRDRAPNLGEHTHQVLTQDLGLNEQEIAALTAGGSDQMNKAATHHTTQPAAHHAAHLQKGVLSGIRVLDFTWKTVGPWAPRLLTHYGAEVIHVERAGGWDDHRFAAHRSLTTDAPEPNHVQGEKQLYTDPYFNTLHHGKLAISLNTRHPEGIKIVERLITECDAIVENFSADVFPSWGLTWERIHQLNPRIIYMSSSGFGHTGEWKGYRSFGPTAAAQSGLSLASGLPGQPPAGWGFSYLDVMGGWMGGLALMQGLLQVKKTGKGFYIDYSVTEGAMTMVGTYMLDYQVNGRRTRRPGFPPGNRAVFPPVAPHNTYRCAGHDRVGQHWWVLIACETQAQFEALCAVMHQPGLALDPKFATNEARVAHQDELDAIIGRWTRARRRYDIMRQCQAAGIIAAVVQSAEDRVEYDPQLQHREMFPIIDHPDLGECPYEGYPPKLSRTPAFVHGRAPTLAEHNQYVYGELLGMSETDIAGLRERGVI